jgi:hypothetical protein
MAQWVVEVQTPERSADGAEISVSAPALKIHESRQDRMLNVECIEGFN